MTLGETGPGSTRIDHNRLANMKNQLIYGEDVRHVFWLRDINRYYQILLVTASYYRSLPVITGFY